MKASPLALAVIVEQMKRGSQMSRDRVIEMEYYLCNAFFRREHSDAKEGIRAMLVEKDKKPNWRHRSISEVTKEEVDRLFTLRYGPSYDTFKEE